MNIRIDKRTQNKAEYEHSSNHTNKQISVSTYVLTYNMFMCLTVLTGLGLSTRLGGFLFRKLIRESRSSTLTMTHAALCKALARTMCATAKMPCKGIMYVNILRIFIAKLGNFFTTNALGIPRGVLSYG